ncbi:hypothetical protein N0V90_006866 [Kalmusia sp. IMI 367209]|nr:hypothetical protein N0V90_006866 [Kalmusia sp. IMI 367209]
MPQSYRSVPLEEQSQSSHDDASLNEKFEWKSEKTTISQRIRNASTSHWALIVQAVMLSASITFFALGVCMRSTKQADAIPMTFSPLNEAIEYQIKHFDLPPIPGGPFVGKGADVDAMWEWATDGIPDTMVTRDEMVKMNMDPEGALQVTDPATGKRGYRVAIEVFHQLHCLNLLRQANWKAHYAKLGGDTSAEPEDLHGHLDHCIDALRQFVMCQSDTNVFPFRFPFNDGDPWPDYSSPRMCRNYEKVRQWAVDHGVAQGVDEPEH